MATWTETIERRIKEYEDKTDEITTCLRTIAIESREAGIGFGLDFEASELKWKIGIAGMECSINYNEIIDAQHAAKYDEDGNQIGTETIELKDILTKIILERFKWLPYQK